MSSFAALSGIRYFSHYRKFLKLDRVGFVAGALPSVLMPAILTGVAQYQSVLLPLVTIKTAMCPTCFEIRSACIQVIGGVVAPALTCSAVGLYMATVRHTTAMPRWQDFSYWWKFYKDMNKGLVKKFGVYTVGHMAAAIIFVSLCVNSLAKVWDYEHGAQKVVRQISRVESEFDPSQESKAFRPFSTPDPAHIK